MAGITPAGFTLKTLEEIQTDIAADQLGTIDPNLDVSSDAPLGQANAIVARQAALIWELLSTIYNGLNPNAAEGSQLENIAALTGTVRRQATKGTVLLTCHVNAGTTIPAGSFANVLGQPGNKWASVAAVTSLVTGNIQVAFEAEFAGPVIANANTITVITTPVSGWNTVNNPLAATTGLPIETDAEFRLRRAQEVAAPGASTVDALLTDVSRVPNVIQVSVLENTSELYDSNGLPPHSFEVIVWDGVAQLASNDALAAAIWQAKPAGIATHGTTPYSTPDVDGNTRTVRLSRSIQKPLLANVTISVLPGWSASQVSDVQSAMTGILWRTGQDIISSKVVEAIRKVSPLIHDITVLQFSVDGSPFVSGNSAIAPREIAVWGAINVTVTQLTGVP